MAHPYPSIADYCPSIADPLSVPAPWPVLLLRICFRVAGTHEIRGRSRTTATASKPAPPSSASPTAGLPPLMPAALPFLAAVNGGSEHPTHTHVLNEHTHTRHTLTHARYRDMHGRRADV
eukprot:3936214-Rhodomonas_salina.1